MSVCGTGSSCRWQVLLGEAPSLADALVLQWVCAERNPAGKAGARGWGERKRKVRCSQTGRALKVKCESLTDHVLQGEPLPLMQETQERLSHYTDLETEGSRKKTQALYLVQFS